MRNINLVTLFIVLIVSLCCSAQEWQYSEEFNTDFWTGYSDMTKDYVDCSGKSMNAMDAFVCTKKHGIGSVVHKSAIYGTSGLYNKVAAAVEAQRPKKSIGATSKSKTGTYNYQTSDSHIQWLADRNRSIQEAKEQEAERKRREKYEDDMRAAQAEAQANAVLQVETNRRIRNDRWNATEGAALAQQRVKSSIKTRGPQVSGKHSQMTAQQRAGLLRRQNKPRRIMANNTPRNQVRTTLAPVRRTAISTQKQRDMLRRAMFAKAQQRKNKRNGKVVEVGGTKFFLSDNATSTLGQDWTSDDFKPLPPPPPAKPATGTQVRKMTQAEYHHLIVAEMIEQRPLTPAELKYYQKLTL